MAAAAAGCQVKPRGRPRSLGRVLQPAVVEVMVGTSGDRKLDILVP